MNDMSQVHKGKLMSDLRVVIADAEELLRITSDQASDSAADVRTRSCYYHSHTARPHDRHLQFDTAVAQAPTNQVMTRNPITLNPTTPRAVLYIR